MNAAKNAKNAAKILKEPLEALLEEVKPKDFLTEAIKEIAPFTYSGAPSASSHEIAKNDLDRARQEEQLTHMVEEEQKETEASIVMVKQQYSSHESAVSAHDQAVRREFVDLQTEIAALAKASGVDTKAHLENVPQKVGILDIRRLTSIVRFLRFKVETSKDASDLVAQRQNAKRSTGMMAWVSGKQMKIHEQGTMQLQG